MGQFSWLDCRTQEQIVDDKERNVYVLVPKEFGGGHIEESCYDGYGHFGGYDIFDIVVDWNVSYVDEILAKKDEFHSGWVTTYEEDFKRLARGEACETEKRILGIAIACYDEDNEKLHYPIKITHDSNAVYEKCSFSLSDPNQGWEMGEDEYVDF